MDVCEHCKKPKACLFVIDAAPEVPMTPKTDPKLREQMRAEGRGAVLGPLKLCPGCYLQGFPDKNKKPLEPEVLPARRDGAFA